MEYLHRLQIYPGGMKNPVNGHIHLLYGILQVMLAYDIKPTS